MLVGFHGYAETDEIQLERLRNVPHAARWTLVSIQGLHRFYRGRGADRLVVASWMTRQDRELAIGDNLTYVQAVLAAVTSEHKTRGPVVFAGFSQGAAMAFRAAALLDLEVSGVMAFGGDIPPDLSKAALSRIGRALVGRGTADAQYTHPQWTSDVARLRDAGAVVDALAFDGGHEWSGAVSDAAGAFLSRLPAPST